MIFISDLAEFVANTSPEVATEVFTPKEKRKSNIYILLALGIFAIGCSYFSYRYAKGKHKNDDE